MDRAQKFVEIGVDRLRRCSTVDELDRCKDYSCMCCVRKNLDLACNKCGISQCALQLESIMKGGERQ